MELFMSQHILQHAKEAILSIQKEISEKERKIHACESCFEHLEGKNSIEKSLDMVESSISDATKKIQDFKMKSVSLNEQLSLAKKLHLENGKCPVCDSSVEHLNPLFREEHLKDELDNLKKQISSQEKQLKAFDDKKLDFEGVKTYSLKERKSKVSEEDFAAPSKPDTKICDFINNLPDILVAKDFKDFMIF